MICTECGRTYNGKKLPNGLCQACYNYFRKGGENHPLPPKGVIQHDERGYVICHICGKAYKKLGSHARESHGMTIRQYKEEFGLCNNARTTETEYSEKMHNYAYKYNMPQQLIATGKNTRVKKGQTDMRKGKEVRLQERIDKRNRRKAV